MEARAVRRLGRLPRLVGEMGGREGGSFRSRSDEDRSAVKKRASCRAHAAVGERDAAACRNRRHCYPAVSRRLLESCHLLYVGGNSAPSPRFLFTSAYCTCCQSIQVYTGYSHLSSSSSTFYSPSYHDRRTLNFPILDLGCAFATESSPACFLRPTRLFGTSTAVGF